MGAKEKAIELVNKMYYVHGLMDSDMAMQCAIIAVDEILKSRPCIPSPIPCESMDECIMQANYFWKEVKQEINKL